MDCKKALEILNINHYSIKYTDINKKYLTKQYRKMALKYHPDKHGNSKESTQKFIQLVDAYNLLLKEVSVDVDGNEEFVHETETHNNLYSSFLKLFMKNVMENDYNEIILITVNKILSQCLQISDHIFDNVSKDICIKIYHFLSTYRSTLHLSDEFIDKIRNIVIKKYDNVMIYKLNPSLSDLIDNNYYKLYIKDEFILIPLWMDELYYECSGIEVIVFCDPILPNNVFIDDDNNIIINMEIDYKKLITLLQEDNNLKFMLDNKEFEININNLTFKKKQLYRIKNSALPKNNEDIEKINDKTDIIVQLTISI